MQQDAPEDHLSGMTASVPEINKLEFCSQRLNSRNQLHQPSSNCPMLPNSGAASGTNPARASTLETHGFLVIDGALRLFAQEPSSDLFSVGRVDAGGVVGAAGLLRQGACEVRSHAG